MKNQLKLAMNLGRIFDFVQKMCKTPENFVQKMCNFAENFVQKM